MSTKKFMTATGTNRELQISRSNEDGVTIRLYDPGFESHRAKTFFLNPSEAPALALAILEAALGDHDACSMEFAEALSGLRREVRRIEERDTAAKEQEELEAEALELFNAFATSFDRRKKTSSVDTLKENDVYNHWLAVARRAREMRESNA